jgi:hypothetical protein
LKIRAICQTFIFKRPRRKVERRFKKLSERAEIYKPIERKEQSRKPANKNMLRFKRFFTLVE